MGMAQFQVPTLRDVRNECYHFSGEEEEKGNSVCARILIGAKHEM